MTAIPRGHLASRLASGAFILHSGLQKRKADEETATGLHGFAATAYPFLADVEPRRFARLLAAGEMAVGAALLLPVVPNRLAGAALSGFSGALLGLYAKAPGLREAGSIWPTQQGTAVAKDVWLLALGIDLLTD
jgi:hypothetical protein